MMQAIIANKEKELKNHQFAHLDVKKSKRSFTDALYGQHHLIAEIKIRSPSAGELISHSDVTKLVGNYNKHASAISVVTDKQFFGGDPELLKTIRSQTSLPLLRKDFIIHENQLYESRYLGADAVLLIASVLSTEQIHHFISILDHLSMDAVVEVHTDAELENAKSAGARIIGINNRDLGTMTVDVQTTARLRSRMPQHIFTISESGISTYDEILAAQTNAVLIGTSILKSGNPELKLKELSKSRIKICGITNLKDAQMCLDLGADYLGFNFYQESSRYIEPDEAVKICDALPNTVSKVGIFVNEDAEKVKNIASKCKLNILQFHGVESPLYCAQFSLAFIKAIRVTEPVSKRLVDSYDGLGILFDSFIAGKHGGTGEIFDYTFIPEFAGKTFISGGLDERNVSAAIAPINPYCVDVCTGTESRPGIKDKSKIQNFISKVKDAI